MFLQYFVNIDMASQEIPYEDEVTPHEEFVDKNGANKDGGPSSDDNDATTLQPPTDDSEHSERISDDDSSDEVAKMERTVAEMKAKLKSLGKQKKKRRSRPPVEGGPSSSVNPEDIENIATSAPPRKSRKISSKIVDTSSATTAFTPRLDASVPPLRRANKQHLRSAHDTHLRSVENNLLHEQFESDPNEDDTISLLDHDDDTWSPSEQEDGSVHDDAVDLVDPGSPTIAAEDEDDYEALISTLDFVTSTESAGPDINSVWAEKLKASWVEENNLHSMKPLYEKYKVPANCDTICAPAMNNEMKRLMTSKWDKKTDITYNGMQKTLTKVLAATIQLNTLNMGRVHDQETRQKGMQITADVVTMLGQVNYELSNRRKFHLGKSILPKYRPLCAKDTVKPTKTLFGDNISQLIKDVNLRSKIGYDGDNRGQGRGRRSSNQPFLGFGRGRSQGRAPRGRGFHHRGGYQQQFLNHGQSSSHHKGKKH